MPVRVTFAPADDLSSPPLQRLTGQPAFTAVPNGYSSPVGADVNDTATYGDLIKHDQEEGAHAIREDFLNEMGWEVVGTLQGTGRCVVATLSKFKVQDPNITLGPGQSINVLGAGDGSRKHRLVFEVMVWGGEQTGADEDNRVRPAGEFGVTSHLNTWRVLLHDLSRIDFTERIKKVAVEIVRSRQTALATTNPGLAAMTDDQLAAHLPLLWEAAHRECANVMRLGPVGFNFPDHALAHQCCP